MTDPMHPHQPQPEPFRFSKQLPQQTGSHQAASINALGETNSTPGGGYSNTSYGVTANPSSTTSEISDVKSTSTNRQPPSEKAKSENPKPEKTKTEDTARDEITRKERRAIKKQKRIDARIAWRNSGVGWRVFPRTLLGIVVSILVFAVGAGISGAVLFAYYEARVTDSENKITEFSAGLDQRISEGVTTIETTSAVAQERLAVTLGPYADIVQNESGLPRVAAITSPSTVLVETRDVEGKQVFGTATAIGKNENQTVFVTSFEVVKASVADPGPDITLRKGEDRWGADLVSWDPELELAVLVSDVDLPAAPFAPVDNIGVLVGSPVFALSALNDSLSPGVVVAVTSDGFRHTGAVDSDFYGGPIVAQNGEVVGFTTRKYAPDGIPGGNVPWAPTVTQLCDTLLVCENSSPTVR